MASWKKPLRAAGENFASFSSKFFTNRIVVTLFSALFIIGGTLLAVQLGKGYRPSKEGILQPTGLLSANSYPTGAQVFLDGRLITATNNTLNLQPGEYLVEIKKEGFTSWSKRLLIEKELVSQTNALLFPSAPSLTPLSFAGAQNVVPSPDGQKIVFYSSSASAELRNGLYVLELSTSLLPNQRGPRQIMEPTNLFDLETATIIWSPDSSQILLSQEDRNILIDPTRVNDPDSTSDVTYRLGLLFDEWEAEMYTRERVRLLQFPAEIQQVASESAVNVYVSPDNKKVMYTATKEFSLAENLLDAPQSANTQTQERTLVPGGVYVYDMVEDRNYRVATEDLEKPSRMTLAQDLFSPRAETLESSPSAFRKLQGETVRDTARNHLLHHTNAKSGGLQWLPDSQYLIGLKNDRVVAIEFDATNETVIYAGPLSEPFVYPWPNGSKLVILTNFNNNSLVPNMYSLNLR